MSQPFSFWAWGREPGVSWQIDWERVGRVTFAALEGLRLLGEAYQQGVSAQAASAIDPVAATALEAARVLGVSLDASSDEIRAALRRKLVASMIHPDQGGEVAHARKLIDAKNLLVERAKGKQTRSEEATS